MKHNIKIGNAELALHYDLGSDLAAAIQLCGEAAVYQLYLSAARTALRNRVRVLAKQHGSDAPAIEQALSDWRPGAGTSRQQQSAVDKLKRLLSSCTVEEGEDILRELEAAIAGGGQ